MREGTLGEVATRGVQNALGFPSGARGVQDEQRVLGVNGQRFMFGRLLGQCLMPPNIAALVPIDVLAGALIHENVCAGGGRAASWFTRSVRRGDKLVRFAGVG